MVDVRLGDEIECHWGVIFDEHYGGVYDDKSMLHDKRWVIYMNDKKALISCGYSVEVSGFDGRKVIWEVVDDHVVEEVNSYY